MPWRFLCIINLPVNFDAGDGGQQKPRRRQGSAIVKILAAIGIIGILIALFLPAVRTARPAAYRNACANNLKQIALALQDYADKYHALPPAYTTDENGKPLHSWRTLILPFLEEGELYKSIDLTKPWDDPVNAEAFKTIVHAYRCPANPDEDNRTIYLAVVTPKSCIRATEARDLSEIPNKPQTLMVVEVDLDHAVPWMKPADADENVAMNVGQSRRLAHPGGTNSVFVDCHTEFLEAEMPEAQRRALISADGKDKTALDARK
jgi:prepilin-type processing-associated H-X9-DG protein